MTGPGGLDSEKRSMATAVGWSWLGAVVLTASFALADEASKNAAEALSFWDRLSREWSAAQAWFTGKRSPLAGVRSAQPKRGGGQNEASAKRHAELLHEIWVVALRREPESPQLFAALLQSLQQGASLEGVYNGLVHSRDYREQAEAEARASAAVLNAFAEEWSWLRAEREAEAKNQVEAESAVREEWRKRALEAYAPASLGTLKRELGDEALLLIEAKRKRPERLAHWYSRWVVRMAGRKVPFGLATRERADANFHYAWALEDPQDLRQDLLAWEVLNRLHRVLNAAANPQR